MLISHPPGSKQKELSMYVHWSWVLFLTALSIVAAWVIALIVVHSAITRLKQWVSEGFVRAPSYSREYTDKDREQVSKIASGLRDLATINDFILQGETCWWVDWPHDTVMEGKVCEYDHKTNRYRIGGWIVSLDDCFRNRDDAMRHWAKYRKAKK